MVDFSYIHKRHTGVCTGTANGGSVAHIEEHPRETGLGYRGGGPACQNGVIQGAVGEGHCRATRGANHLTCTGKRVIIGMLLSIYL